MFKVEWYCVKQCRKSIDVMKNEEVVNNVDIENCDGRWNLKVPEKSDDFVNWVGIEKG